MSLKTFNVRGKKINFNEITYVSDISYNIGWLIHSFRVEYKNHYFIVGDFGNYPKEFLEKHRLFKKHEFKNNTK